MPAIDIVQGGNWGSEAKGTVAGYLAVKKQYDFAVRTGAINAGHTVYYKGKPYVNQQIPVAWVNPTTSLVIGPGAYVHLPTLINEITMIAEATGKDVAHVAKRLYIDRRVAVHLDHYADESREVNRHHAIGATGKGCAEAIIHKIKDRSHTASILLMEHVPGALWHWVDVPTMLTDAYDKGAGIMLEGTQGELLDFHLGPWPYVTSRQTTSAAWVAEAGLSPSLQYNIVLVFRTYPIRVAGNSGPMDMEIRWTDLAWSINRFIRQSGGGPDHPLYVDPMAIEAFTRAVDKIGADNGVPNLGENHRWDDLTRYANRALLSEYSTTAMSMVGDKAARELKKLFEFTTVTKKLRRVSQPIWSEYRRTIDRVKPGMVVLTFLNYLFPELHLKSKVSEEALYFVKNVMRTDMVNLGPEPEHMVEV